MRARNRDGQYTNERDRDREKEANRGRRVVERGKRSGSLGYTWQRGPRILMVARSRGNGYEMRWCAAPERGETGPARTARGTGTDERGGEAEGDGDGTKGGGERWRTCQREEEGGAEKGRKKETGTRRRRNIQATLGEHGDRRENSAREKERTRDVVAGGGGSGGGVAINTEPPEQNHPSTSICLSLALGSYRGLAIFLL